MIDEKGLSAEVRAYWLSRDAVWRKVFATLRDYRMQNMSDADDPSCAYPLVDLMSNDGASIATGEEEMVNLADEISLALSTLSLGTRITLADGTEAVVVPVVPDRWMQSAMAFYHIKHAGAAGPAELELARASYRAMLSALETK